MMTLRQTIEFMNMNQNLWIFVMHTTLFRGSKDRLLRTAPMWLDDVVVNMKGNSDSDIEITLEDSEYTRDFLCEKILESNILDAYLKHYRSEPKELFYKHLKLLMEAIREDNKDKEE